MLVALLALLALASFAPQRGDARHKHCIPHGTGTVDSVYQNTVSTYRTFHIKGPIFRYDLSWADDDAEDDVGTPVPFEARVMDTAAGTAQIRHRDAASALDCSAKAEYRVRLHAVKCGDDAAKSEA